MARRKKTDKQKLCIFGIDGIHLIYLHVVRYGKWFVAVITERDGKDCGRYLSKQGGECEDDPC